MDISQAGLLQMATYTANRIIAPAFADYPNTGPDGVTNIGAHVYSFYAETVAEWPGVITRFRLGHLTPAGIGDLVEVETQSVAGYLPAGYSLIGTIGQEAQIELRLGGRSEVERERLVDWAITKLYYRIPLPDGSPSYRDRLAEVGLTITGAQDPVMPDMDPSAERPQGMPPWPAQIFFTVWAEFYAVCAPNGTLAIATPSYAIYQEQAVPH